MLFDNALAGINSWTWRYTYYGNSVDTFIGKLKTAINGVGGVDNVPEADLTALVLRMSNGSTRSILGYTHPSKKILLQKELMKMKITKKDFLSLLRASKKGEDTSWIDIWMNKPENKDVEFNNAEKKRLAGKGYVYINKNDKNITQATFATYFSNKSFIKMCLGTVCFHKSMIGVNTGGFGGEDDVPSGYYKMPDGQMFIEHKETLESAKTYVDGLKNSTLSTMLDNSKLHITMKCIYKMCEAFPARKYVYLLRILSIMDDDAIKKLDLKLMDLVPEGGIVKCERVGYVLNRSIAEELVKKMNITEEDILSCTRWMNNTIPTYSSDTKYYRSLTELQLAAMKKINFKMNIEQILCNFKSTNINNTTYVDELFTYCGVTLTDETLDLAIRYCCHMLINRCKNRGLRLKAKHFKYAILYKHSTLLQDIIDQRLLPSKDDVQYYFDKSVAVAKILIENIFDMTPEEFREVGIDVNNTKSFTVRGALSSNMEPPPFLSLEDPSKCDFKTTGGCHLVLYYMKFPHLFNTFTLNNLMASDATKDIRLFFYNKLFKDDFGDKVSSRQAEVPVVKDAKVDEDDHDENEDVVVVNESGEPEPPDVSPISRDAIKKVKKSKSDKKTKKTKKTRKTKVKKVKKVKKKTSTTTKSKKSKNLM